MSSSGVVRAVVARRHPHRPSRHQPGSVLAVAGQLSTSPQKRVVHRRHRCRRWGRRRRHLPHRRRRHRSEWVLAVTGQLSTSPQIGVAVDVVVGIVGAECRTRRRRRRRRRRACEWFGGGRGSCRRRRRSRRRILRRRWRRWDKRRTTSPRPHRQSRISLRGMLAVAGQLSRSAQKPSASASSLAIVAGQASQASPSTVGPSASACGRVGAGRAVVDVSAHETVSCPRRQLASLGQASQASPAPSASASAWVGLDGGGAVVDISRRSRRHPRRRWRSFGTGVANVTRVRRTVGISLGGALAVVGAVVDVGTETVAVAVVVGVVGAGVAHVTRAVTVRHQPEWGWR